jgi:transposase
MCAVSARLGMTAESLRKWVRQAEVDAGEAAGVPSETARAAPQEPRAGGEILKAATSFFARECDPLRHAVATLRRR